MLKGFFTISILFISFHNFFLISHVVILLQHIICFFPLFSIVSLAPFISKPEYLKDITNFILSSISSFEIINVVVPEPRVCYEFQRLLLM